MFAIGERGFHFEPEALCYKVRINHERPTMQRMIAVLLVAGFLALGGCGDDDPAAQLETINALLAKDFPLTAEQKAEVERSTARGNELLQAGDLEKAGAAFEEAIAVLEFAEDAAMFNKSE